MLLFTASFCMIARNTALGAVLVCLELGFMILLKQVGVNIRFYAPYFKKVLKIFSFLVDISEAPTKLMFVAYQSFESEAS
jgi:hypothetical protein